MLDYNLHVLRIAVENVEDIRDIYRHWHSDSEKFTGGDSLATALLLGWSVRDVVFLDRYRFNGTRRVNVYHFELLRGDEVMRMAVISNPYVERLINEASIRVIALAKRKPVRFKALRGSRDNNDAAARAG
jgi:hypothetical protein